MPPCRLSTICDPAIDREAPGTPVRIGPAASDEPTVPPEERLGPHQEVVPAAPRQHSTQRREHQPVVRLEPRPAGLPAKNRKLVPEHEDLQLLRTITANEKHE